MDSAIQRFNNQDQVNQWISIWETRKWFIQWIAPWSNFWTTRTDSSFFSLLLWFLILFQVSRFECLHCKSTFTFFVCLLVFFFFFGHFNQLSWLNVGTFPWGCICRGHIKVLTAKRKFVAVTTSSEKRQVFEKFHFAVVRWQRIKLKMYKFDAHAKLLFCSFNLAIACLLLTSPLPLNSCIFF